MNVQKTNTNLKAVSSICSTFLYQRNGRPLFRRMPFCGAVSKVKLRFRQRSEVAEHVCTPVSEVTNIHNIARRTVVGYTYPLHDKKPTHDDYYVFVPNGFRCFYPRSFTDSASIENVRNSVDELISDPDSLIESIVKLDYYVGDSIADVPVTTKEIAFYNVPCFYVIHTSAFETYDDLLKEMG